MRTLTSRSSGNYGNMPAAFRGPAPVPQTYGNTYAAGNNTGLHHAPPPPQPFYGQPPPSQMFHQPMPNAYQQMGQMPRAINPMQPLDTRAFVPNPQHGMPMQNRS